MNIALDITTFHRLRDDVYTQYPHPAEGHDVMTRLAVWLARGDQVLVYENRELGHYDLGSHLYISYGSSAAQIESTLYPEPPVIMPDIGGLIGWRYQLVGVVADGD